MDSLSLNLPQNSLHLVGLQLGLFSKSIAENIERLLSSLKSIEAGSADLVVCPEVSNTFYHYEVIEGLRDGEEAEFLERFSQICTEKGFCLVIGLAVRDCGLLRNRAYFIDSKGSICAHYDKLHLISLLDEDTHFTPGSSITSFMVKGWKVGVGICFDLRFAEIFINYALDGCHLIVLPACFPSERKNHWRNLILARAQECQCFFLGVNMGGKASTRWGEKTYGGTLLASPDSVPLAELPWGEEGILRCEITSAEIARQKAFFDLMANRPRPPLTPGA